MFQRNNSWIIVTKEHVDVTLACDEPNVREMEIRMPLAVLKIEKPCVVIAHHFLLPYQMHNDTFVVSPIDLLYVLPEDIEV